MIPSRCLPFSAEGEVPRTCVWRADGGMTPRARAGAGTARIPRRTETASARRQGVYGCTPVPSGMTP